MEEGRSYLRFPKMIMQCGEVIRNAHFIDNGNNDICITVYKFQGKFWWMLRSNGGVDECVQIC